MPGVRLIQLKPRCSWGLSSNYKRDKVGIQSIRRLEEAGIESIKDLALLRTEDLVKGSAAENCRASSRIHTAKSPVSPGSIGITMQMFAMNVSH